MINKRRLFTLPDGTQVYRVSGPAVRKQHVEFVQGGHGLVYKWIPKGEVWVERMRSRKDECYILFHEVAEQQLMRYRGMKYAAAHAIANREEQQLRRDGVDVCKRIQEVWG